LSKRAHQSIFEKRRLSARFQCFQCRFVAHGDEKVSDVRQKHCATLGRSQRGPSVTGFCGLRSALQQVEMPIRFQLE
jgi:hypothetical protein